MFEITQFALSEVIFEAFKSTSYKILEKIITGDTITILDRKWDHTVRLFFL